MVVSSSEEVLKFKRRGEDMVVELAKQSALQPQKQK